MKNVLSPKTNARKLALCLLPMFFADGYTTAAAQSPESTATSPINKSATENAMRSSGKWGDPRLFRDLSNKQTLRPGTTDASAPLPPFKTAAPSGVTSVLDKAAQVAVFYFFGLGNKDAENASGNLTGAKPRLESR
jgi:hypothetical protein